MRFTVINAAAALATAAMVVTAGSAAASAAGHPGKLVPAGTGEPIASLNAITADGTIAVGADSINVFLNPLCGQDLAEHRGTSGWTSLRTPSPACGWLASVAGLSRHRAWAVGYLTTKTAAVRTLTEFYNGSRWSIEPSPSPGTSNYLRGVAVTRSGTVWAVGSNTSGSLIFKRSGSHWVQATQRFQSDLQAITVTPGGQVWAVGLKSDPVTFAVDTTTFELTGSGWKEVASPNPGGANSSYLTAVAAGPHGALWAVGWYYDPVTFAMHTLTMHYVSGHWVQVASPSPGTSSNWLYSVAVTSSGQVWAVGGYSGPRCERNLVEHYLGGAWHVVSVPDHGGCPQDTNALYGVTVTGGKVLAVGEGGIDTLAEEDAGRWKIVRSAN